MRSTSYDAVTVYRVPALLSSLACACDGVCRPWKFVRQPRLDGVMMM